MEDDEKIRDELSVLLQKYGYPCVSSEDSAHLPEIILERKPQLVLLDLNLPVSDGYRVCRALREKSNVPIIVVTSRDTETDELLSMNFGADDFIPKPYNTQILLARIAAVLKRAYPAEPPETLCCRGLELDLARSAARYRGRRVELTKNEVRILSLLMRNSGRIVPRSEIMNSLWQSDEFVDDNTLTVNINRLRRKLESVGLRNFPVTKRGQGYLI